MTSILFLPIVFSVGCGGAEELVVTTADQEIVVGSSELQALRESMPGEVFVDGKSTGDMAALLVAKRVEFQFEGTNVAVTPTDDGVDVEASDGTSTKLQIRRNGSILEFEGQATVSAPSEELAGMVYLDAIRNAVRMQQAVTLSTSYNPYQCWYACYEISIGLGAYICRYYPNGLGKMFGIRFLYLPCFAGEVVLNFTCYYLPLIQNYDCSGNNL
jgi:hypothetical protein